MLKFSSDLESIFIQSFVSQVSIKLSYCIISKQVSVQHDKNGYFLNFFIVISKILFSKSAHNFVKALRRFFIYSVTSQSRYVYPMIQ